MAYNEFRRTVNKFAQPISIQLKKTIINIFYPFSNIIYNMMILSNKNHHDISVKTYDETIEDMERKSLIRFGDGEFTIIGGGDITYQQYSKELADKLSIILLSNFDNLTVCIPDIFGDMKHWDNKSRKFWCCFRALRYNILQNNTQLAINYKYGSATVTRPYMGASDYTKHLSKKYYDNLKKLWDGKDIVFIEGKTTRNGVGNDLYENANSIRRIICPHTNAYTSYGDILKVASKIDKTSLIIISLGPAGKILGFELCKQGYHVLDLGHIDSDYEWFIHNENNKVSYNNNKHTAECDDSEKNITDCLDEKYLREIIDVID